MLEKVKIENVKSINQVEIEFGKLNLLVGMNSSGKSTVIQAILFVIQYVSNQYMRNKFFNPLNGPLISWGDFIEVKNYNKHTREFSVELYGTNGIIKVSVSQNEDNSINHGLLNDHDVDFEEFDYHNKKINYISSNRIGSQDLYNKNYENSHLFGINGEYSVHYFDEHKNDFLIEELRVESDGGYTLDAQLNHWLKKILNTEIRTETIQGTDKVKLSFIHGNFEGTPRLVRPKNIGAGLSYVISILIAGLSSKVGDLIIIENPEIQLHPKAQSGVAEFLAHISNSGVELIIETHSDHIFNGVRKSIFNKEINKDDVKIYYFSSDERMSTNVSKIELDSNGVILNHELGLFDQFDEDLDVLLGL